MFDNLFKHDVYELYAPVKGESFPITEVNDKIFSEKLMGDGIAFKLDEEGIVYAPCYATIKVLPQSKHAIGLSTDNGIEFIIHVGMNTVELNGKGFEAYVRQGQKVRKGQRLLKVDIDFMKENNIDITTPMVIVSHDKKYTITNNMGRVDNNDVVIKFEV